MFVQIEVSAPQMELVKEATRCALLAGIRPFPHRFYTRLKVIVKNSNGGWNFQRTVWLHTTSTL